MKLAYLAPLVVHFGDAASIRTSQFDLYTPGDSPDGPATVFEPNTESCPRPLNITFDHSRPCYATGTCQDSNGSQSLHKLSCLRPSDGSFYYWEASRPWNFAGTHLEIKCSIDGFPNALNLIQATESTGDLYCEDPSSQQPTSSPTASPSQAGDGSQTAAPRSHDSFGNPVYWIAPGALFATYLLHKSLQRIASDVTSQHRDDPEPGTP